MPQTLVNQACLDIQAGRAEVVLIAGAETLRTRTRIAQPRAEAELDESGRVRADRARAPTRTSRWPGPPRFGSAWTGPRTSIRCSSRRCGSRRGVAGAPSQRIGELWSQFSAVAHDNPYAWSRTALTAEQIWQPDRRQPDDQLAVHQADELKQHGRSGRGPHPGLGREGDTSADPHRALGFPVCGHRRT